jgi:hypothetical protein
MLGLAALTGSIPKTFLWSHTYAQLLHMDRSINASLAFASIWIRPPVVQKRSMNAWSMPLLASAPIQSTVKEILS